MVSSVSCPHVSRLQHLCICNFATLQFNASRPSPSFLPNKKKRRSTPPSSALYPAIPVSYRSVISPRSLPKGWSPGSGRFVGFRRSGPEPQQQQPAPPSSPRREQPQRERGSARQRQRPERARSQRAPGWPRQRRGLQRSRWQQRARRRAQRPRRAEQEQRRPLRPLRQEQLLSTAVSMQTPGQRHCHDLCLRHTNSRSLLGLHLGRRGLSGSGRSSSLSYMGNSIHQHRFILTATGI